MQKPAFSISSLEEKGNVSTRKEKDVRRTTNPLESKNLKGFENSSTVGV
jgi:hypothetical protein